MRTRREFLTAAGAVAVAGGLRPLAAFSQGKDILLGGVGSDYLHGGDDFDWLIELDDEEDQLIGGGGSDVSLGDPEDDADQVERVTTTVLAFLLAI